MKIQSFSVVVPNKECANKCPFCVSRMVNSNTYPNLMDINHPHYDINVSEYLKRMRYVSDLGCKTMMLTGTSEPQQNKQFLATLALLHRQIGSPFTNIEMQTTGLFLNGNRDYIRFLRNFVGINTMALSVNAMDDEKNNEILGHNLPDRKIVLTDLCELLREYDFNIRICYNLNDSFNDYSFDDIIEHAINVCNANQVTFRKLYSSDDSTPQGKWIKNHYIAYDLEREIELALSSTAFNVIGKTQYGTPIYDVDGMSVIYDIDCMGKAPETETLKYLILRPNCKLYSSWDSKASLVF